MISRLPSALFLLPAPLTAQQPDNDDFLRDGYHGNTTTGQQVGFGPLQIPSQGIGQTLRLGLEPKAPSTLARNQWEVDVDETLANTFSNRPGNDNVIQIDPTTGSPRIDLRDLADLHDNPSERPVAQGNHAGVQVKIFFSPKLG